MIWTLSEVTPPTEDPISLVDAKHHLRVDHDADDDLIAAQIKAATAWVEDYTGRQLVDATWKLTLDRWPAGDELYLPRPPITSVTSITYTKSDNTTATMPAADYHLDNSDDYGPHRIYLDYNASWPSDTLRLRAGVEILYDTGYGTAADLPEPFKTALKMVIGTLYENRETEIVGKTAAQLKHSAEWLLYTHRVFL